MFIEPITLKAPKERDVRIEHSAPSELCLNGGCVFYRHFVPNGTNNPNLNENRVCPRDR